MKADRKRIDYFPYFLLIPTIIILITFITYPVFYSVIISFFDYSFLKVGRSFVLFENYTRLLRDNTFFNSLVISIKWTAVNLVLMSALGFTTALVLRSKFIGSGLLKVVLLIPWVLPQIVTGFTWGLMLTQDIGIINEILFRFGVVERSFSWFQTGRMAFWAIVLANTWRGFPFFSLMLYAKLQTIPSELIEAAMIDGASPTQVFYHIMLEFMKPVFKICLMLSFIWTFNAFDIISTMTNGGPLEQTLTLPVLVQREAFQYMQISRASTMSVLMFISMSTILAAGYCLMQLWKKKERRDA